MTEKTILKFAAAFRRSLASTVDWEVTLLILNFPFQKLHWLNPSTKT